MAEPRPSLKLKLSSKKFIKQEPVETPTPSSASTKLKFKVKPSKPAQAAPTAPTTPAVAASKPATKSGRKPKATPKKRAAEEAGSGSESEPLAKASAAVPKHPSKKIKLSFGQKPKPDVQLRIKAKGRVPPRPLGIGYDSEDDEREKDPVLDSNFVLRMTPGDDCDYLRKALLENTIGIGKTKGGADVRMRFLTKDSRRAVVQIRGHHYAAVLVDLPCVIESMKSWNKKDFYKSADICQMLLVLGSCKTEEEAKTYPLPTQKGEFDEKTWQWAHGITPPMRWARKRRFRKRLSTKAVEEDEQEVERLLQADEECIPGSSRYRYIDQEDLEREASDAIHESEEDAEGELDDTVLETTETQPMPTEVDEDDEDLEAHFEREMAKAAEESEASLGAATPSQIPAAIMTSGLITESPAATPASFSAAAITTPPPGAVSSAEDKDQESDEDEEDDEDEDDDDDDDDADGTSAVDDDLLEQQQDMQRQREEISDLEAAIAREEQRLANTANGILRQKIGRTILALRSDLEVKKGSSSGGDGGEDG